MVDTQRGDDVMTEQAVQQWIEYVTSQDAWAQVVARAWADEAFQARLVTDPTAVLREAGPAVPAGIEVREQEAPAHGAYLVLPPKPPADAMYAEPLVEVRH